MCARARACVFFQSIGYHYYYYYYDDDDDGAHSGRRECRVASGGHAAVAPSTRHVPFESPLAGGDSESAPPQPAAGTGELDGARPRVAGPARHPVPGPGRWRLTPGRSEAGPAT